MASLAYYMAAYNKLRPTLQEEPPEDSDIID